jgi:hypothetical protein
MKTREFPYRELEPTPAWRVVEEAMERLVRNNDLLEQTDRRYIVGLLVNSLHEKGMLTAEATLEQKGR